MWVVWIWWEMWSGRRFFSVVWYVVFWWLWVWFVWVLCVFRLVYGCWDGRRNLGNLVGWLCSGVVSWLWWVWWDVGLYWVFRILYGCWVCCVCWFWLVVGGCCGMGYWCICWYLVCRLCCVLCILDRGLMIWRIVFWFSWVLLVYVCSGLGSCRCGCCSVWRIWLFVCCVVLCWCVFWCCCWLVCLMCICVWCLVLCLCVFL